MKCAARDGVTHRLVVLQKQRRWSWLLWATGALGVIVLSFLQRTAGVMLPLCPACDGRWRRAVRARSLTALSFVPLSFLALGSFIAEARGSLPEHVAGWLSLALLIAWIATFVAVRATTERDLVTAAAIDRDSLSLRGVHPQARRALPWG